MSSINIFESFLRGEPRGFNLIYLTYQHPLREFARKQVRREDLADDAVSEAFVLLLEKISSFKSDIHIQRFLYLVVKYYCRTERRLMRRLITKLPAGWDTVDPEASELAVLKELNAHNQWIIDKMRDRLDELPEQRRADFHAYFFNLKNFKDIARERGVAVDTVRVNVLLATKEIQKYLETNHYPGYSKKS